jgi:glycosyltransferase involved in cell wall biosynthesis
VPCDEIDLVSSIQYPKKFIMGAGRLVHQKQFDYLISAYFKICALVEEDLVIFGKGDLEYDLKNLCSDLGIENRVHFMGFTKDIWSFLKSSNLFVLSSKYEGFPLILLEAMRCKTAVISFDCNSGPNEIIENGINGVLIEDNNIDELADNILDLLENENKRIRYISNSFNKVLHFDSKNIVTRYEFMFDRILKKSLL